MKKFFLVLAIVSLSITANSVYAQKEFVLMGYMEHTDIEGGCWYLQSKQQKYELTGTPEILQTCQVEGRHLTLNVREAKTRQSICMLGKIVEVVEVLDSVIHPHNPPVFDKMIKGTIHKTKSGCWYVLTTNKHKFELQAPIPKQFMRVGVRYNRMSKVIPGGEGNCDMEGVITISLLEPDMQPKGAKEKKNDPR